MSVGVEPGGDRLVNALRSVQAAGVEVDDIALRQPKLDEVFLALTGQALEDESGSAAPGHAA